MGFIRQILSSLRLRLLLLVLLVCSPLVALTLHTAGEQRREELRAWEGRAQRLCAIIQKEEDVLFTDTRLLLFGLAESAPVASDNRKASAELLNNYLHDRPYFANLGVMKLNGQLLAAARPEDSSSLVLPPEFLEQVVSAKDFVPMFSAGNPTQGPPTMLFGLPVFDKNNQVKSVVYAVLDPGKFDREYSQAHVHLPTNATSWTKLDPQGIVLARQPSSINWVGKPFPDSSLLRDIVAITNQTTGVYLGPGNPETPTVHAFAYSDSKFWPGRILTILSTSKAELFRKANSALYQNLSWLGGAAAVALFLGWAASNVLVLRPLQALAHSTARLVSGNKARSGLPHGRHVLGQLSHYFDRLAEELKKLEVEREHAREKVRSLSQRLVTVQEKERRQIARELHDEIGQSLTAAEMHLQAALQTPEAALLEQRLEESIKAVERVLEQVHDLSLNLRPSMLDDLGLVPALRWYANRQANTIGLKVDFELEKLDHRLDPYIETECFRVAQEAVNNVVRHARASRLELELKQQDGELHLFVRDDGIGFNVEAARTHAVQGASLGVLSMEERAALSGGELKITSRPGHGTQVHAWFPLNTVSTEVVLND
jgi:signal transduction histidine kinase